ncbi:zinc finger CCCH domain-containing protein 62-like isoform X2 [Asparagus officinalis]|uniref:zinc finger CCCH domain-containing protein 62-like isoform X2 n=1 Tax=Asparagus officinalis TaxID=4686 RepID=UPI00098E4FA1|nr:zinc finger CCCH domain-containing protein 62-like isoform X2 [Asparagus officinalis]
MAAAASRGKRAVVCIRSSSEDEEEGEASESEFDSESEEEPESEEESYEEELISEDGSGSSNDDADEDSEDGDDESKGKSTVEERCNKVVDLLRGGKNLNVLKLEECRAYLRKHELRITGTKETSITRILEHWRIKDGNGVKLYPESTFVINCTGDVCRGDIVKFKQRVYEKFNKVKKGGGAKIIGKRIVAGRVVSESYGADKQQHTFSPWPNESERSRILAEKHSRGAAARHIRAISKAKATNGGAKRKKNSSTTKAPPNKKCKKDTQLVTEKKKQNFVKKAGSYSRDGKAKMRKTAKKRNTGSSSTHCNTKISEVANTRNPGSSFSHPEQYSYLPIHTDHYYPQSNPYNIYNHKSAEAFHRNYNQTSSHNFGISSSAARIPNVHMLHGYNTGFVPYARDQMSTRVSYVTHPYDGNPQFQLDPRRRVAFDDRAAGHQFHEWRRH